MEIRPIMTHLPKPVDTYNAVCGEHNPFDYQGAEYYGYSAVILHTFMQSFYGNLPVMNDYAKLSVQVAYTMTANAHKYAAMYKMLSYVDAQEISTIIREMSYTESTDRTGHDDVTKTGTETKTRTGSVSDSGTDSTTNGGTVTDSTTTYESGTLKTVAQSSTSGTGSITHGKTSTYNSVADATTYAGRKDETAYNSTFEKTVYGYKHSPVEQMEMYMKFVNAHNVFMEIINDVVKAISCIIYVPVYPENEEE